MDKKVQIDFDDETYELQFQGQMISVELSKGRFKSTNRGLLAMTLDKDRFLLPGVFEENADSFTWHYKNEQNYQLLEEFFKDMTRSDKLRLLENIAELEKFERSRLNIFLHPQNMLFNDSFRPVIIHRGLDDVVPPMEMKEDKFLRQYKSFVIFLMEHKHSYMDLYQGTLENTKKTPFNLQVLNAKSVEELKKILVSAYHQENERELAVNVTIPRSESRFYKVGFYVVSVLAVILAIITFYFAAIRVPFDNRLLISQKDYLSTNYDQVITDLKNEQPDKLPKPEQYILASSYINIESLSNVQKRNVLKNVNLSSDPSYLQYWIDNGRGEFSKSLNIAQYINDDQLMLYTYTKLYDQVNADPKLSGSQKQSQRAKYQKQIDKYEKKLGGAKNGFGN